MSEKVKQLIRVFTTLSDDDKKEVARILKEYNDSFNKGMVTESLRNYAKDLGPVDTGKCAFCGK